MVKTFIAPIVAVVALVVQGLFGIEVGEDVVAQITQAVGNIVLGVVALVGIVKAFIAKREEKKKEK